MSDQELWEEEGFSENQNLKWIAFHLSLLKSILVNSIDNASKYSLKLVILCLEVKQKRVTPLKSGANEVKSKASCKSS
ncbi:hypothetical protein ABEB36_006501 [Hypothenemus hampei]|uniref:Uncharacterized protein n=1 Tax=Hypothenemus hampei TaxID=57062 RepID=A0ABD1EQR4_HYPHA